MTEKCCFERVCQRHTVAWMGGMWVQLKPQKTNRIRKSKQQDVVVADDKNHGEPKFGYPRVPCDMIMDNWWLACSHLNSTPSAVPV